MITGEVSAPTRPIIIDTGDEQFVIWPEADGSFTIDLDELGITGDVTIYQVDEEGVPGRSVTITRQEDGTTGVRYDSERPTVTDSDQFRIPGERLPATATDMWIVELSGLALLLIGFSTKVVKKFTDK